MMQLHAESMKASCRSLRQADFQYLASEHFVHKVTAVEAAVTHLEEMSLLQTIL